MQFIRRISYKNHFLCFSLYDAARLTINHPNMEMWKTSHCIQLVCQTLIQGDFATVTNMSMDI